METPIHQGDSAHFSYQAAPNPPLLWGMSALVMAAILLPVDGMVRFVVFGFCSGPLMWAYIQHRRAKHRLTLTDSALVVRRALSGRTLHIPYKDIRGLCAYRRDAIVLFYTIPYQPASSSQDGKPTDLTSLHANAQLAYPPKQKLLLSAPLKDQAAFLIALENVLKNSSLPLITEATIRRYINRRQRRDLSLILVGFFSIPLYIVLISQFLRSIP
jgi:hypothetical protein